MKWEYSGRDPNEKSSQGKIWVLGVPSRESSCAKTLGLR